MSVMVEREASRKLDGRVEMDDAVLGGEKGELAGGKRGRGGPNKTPFVVAVETSDDGHPKRLLLHVVERHDEAIEAMAVAHLKPTARIVSDGLGCFRSVKKAGCAHEPIIAAREPQQSEKIPAFRWVNTVLGNIKTAIVGTLKSVASVRWTWNLLVWAEEHKITSANIDEKVKTASKEEKRVLGEANDGFGKPLKLDDKWAYRVIK